MQRSSPLGSPSPYPAPAPRQKVRGSVRTRREGWETRDTCPTARCHCRPSGRRSHRARRASARRGHPVCIPPGTSPPGPAAILWAKSFAVVPTCGDQISRSFAWAGARGASARSASGSWGGRGVLRHVGIIPWVGDLVSLPLLLASNGGTPHRRRITAPHLPAHAAFSRSRPALAITGPNWGGGGLDRSDPWRSRLRSRG